MGDLSMMADATLRLMGPASAGLSCQATVVHSGTVQSCLRVISETSKIGRTGWYIEVTTGDRIYEAEINEILHLQPCDLVQAA